MTPKPGPDELHIEDDEGRAEFRERVTDLVMAAQGFGGGFHGALDDVWHFVFGETYPWPEDWSDPDRPGTLATRPE